MQGGVGVDHFGDAPTIEMNEGEWHSGLSLSVRRRRSSAGPAIAWTLSSSSPRRCCRAVAPYSVAVSSQAGPGRAGTHTRVTLGGNRSPGYPGDEPLYKLG